MYRYIATYKEDNKLVKKSVDLWEKNINKAYEKMACNFGNKNFLELHYSRKI